MGWFPTTRDQSNNGWHFDIVGLLAVIGESSMENHSQAITASWSCVFPRMIPAPQTLLSTERPARLPATNIGVEVMAIYGGTHVKELNYFADIIHDVGSLKAYEFRVYEVNFSDKTLKDMEAQREGKETGEKRKPTMSEFLWNVFKKKQQAHVGSKANNAAEKAAATADVQIEKAGAQNADLPAKNAQQPPELSVVTIAHADVNDPEKGLATTNTKAASKPPMVTNQAIPITWTKRYSPLNILSLLSVLMTAGLFAWSLVIHDGVACVALITMSLSTCLTCIASLWRPELARRSTRAEVPDGDLVIATRSGAFVVVHCDDDVARELYTGTEKCEYLLSPQWHQLLVGVSTALFMVAVVLLGNCEWTMQAAIGAGYIVLNGAYWGIAMIPRTKELTWDMTRYAWKQTNEDDETSRAYEGASSFTRTLWYAIRETRETEWIVRGNVAPRTKGWDKWLAEALENCDEPDWPAVERKDIYMKEAKEEVKANAGRRRGPGSKKNAEERTQAAIEEVENPPDTPIAPISRTPTGFKEPNK